MTERKRRKRRRGVGGVGCAHKIVSIRRVALDRSGYADRGRVYYGTGPHVYQAEVSVPDYKRSGEPDGCKRVYVQVRASDVSAARPKILAEAKRRYR